MVDMLHGDRAPRDAEHQSTSASASTDNSSSSSSSSSNDSSVCVFIDRNTTSTAGRTAEQSGCASSPIPSTSNLDFSDQPLSFSAFLRFIGTGCLIAVSYLDPGNLEADIQVGSSAGYSLLWWYAIVNVCFGTIFQTLAGKVGLVSGKGMAALCFQQYPRAASILLWLLLEASIIAADIQETVGGAIAVSILTSGRVPLYAGCVMVSATAFLLLLLDRLGFKQLEAVFAALIAIEAVAMGINCFQAKVPAKEAVLGLFVPKLTSHTVTVAVAALGALLMPYNTFYNSAIVLNRPQEMRDTDGKKRHLLWYMRAETLIMLLAAFVINLFVVCVFAKGFYPSADGLAMDVGLESAGTHLQEVYGSTFKYLWAVGLLASGQVATICLAHAGQLIMGGLLNMEVNIGMRMVATRCISLVPTVALAVVFEASHTFDQVAQLINIAQGLLMPFGLIPVIHIAANSKIMGRFATPLLMTLFASIIAATVVGVDAYLLLTIMPAHPSFSIRVSFAFLLVLYAALVLYFAVGPQRWSRLLTGALQAKRHSFSFYLSPKAEDPCRTVQRDTGTARQESAMVLQLVP